MSEERKEEIPNCKRIASFLYSDMMVLIYLHRPLLKKLNKSRVPGRLPGTLIYMAWGIGHGELGIGHGELVTTVNSQQSTVNSQQSTVNKFYG
ncbi:hypothetical protein QUA30_09160 [Microcoleus sp. Pol14C2]|uniref:hypothetical protein n=1 Tax=unclassified Microcoleus TaxID=2642155 RepID=UPI002FD66D8C